MNSPYCSHHNDLFYLTSYVQKINADKLFNLFSIYGNIIRIKILRNKPDHALVQMADGLQAELAVHYLKVLCGQSNSYLSSSILSIQCLF